MSLAILNPQDELNHRQVNVPNDNHRRQIIKKKVIAIGKMSRHYNVLKDHPDLVAELKAFNGGKLPFGVLAQGEQGLLNAIANFKAKQSPLKTMLGLEQKDRLSQNEIVATPNTKPREGQV
ncbi:hypothetical protein DM01DRAFT_1334790 [Hesseltinella vesiculosa]|uniref:Uncharacterized protein n=1 Tax=Hesseltinella vesiculosa TaxID=101127 RepID=A0A1X2GL35_9FUNG|nr:hypothetical protein DM01DRAFT_1334790 [Hesseltinella vesiculosa]